MTLQWLDDIEKGSEREVGRKAASLAALSRKGMKVPRAFVVTSGTFENFVQENDLEERIQRILQGTDRSDLGEVREASGRIRSLISGSEISHEVENDIVEAYEKINMSEEVRNAGGEAVDLVGGQRETEFVAVRSSPTGSRIPGVHENRINVNGKGSVMEGIKECWASLYSAEALSIEEEVGELHSMAVMVQKMVEPEVSGSIFTRNSSGESNHVIESVWGLGVSLSSGESNPDRFVIDGAGNVSSEEIANKGWKTIRDPNSGKITRQRVSGSERDVRSLERGQMEGLVSLIEDAGDLYGRSIKLDFGVRKNRTYVFDINRYPGGGSGSVDMDGEPLVRGTGVSGGSVSGKVNILYSDSDLENVSKEEIAVTVKSSEEYVPLLVRAVGVVTDKGGMASNLATLATFLDFPCVVGTGNSTDMLTRGEEVTMNGGSGSVIEEGQEVQHQREVEPRLRSVEFPELLTATDVKVLGEERSSSEGAVIPEYRRFEILREVLESHAPYDVWARTEGGRFDSPGNLRLLADGVSGEVEGRGLILRTFGNVVKMDDFVDRGAELLALDVDALREDGDEEALFRSLETVGSKSRGCETAVLMRNPTRELVRASVEAGMDSVAVPGDALEWTRREVAKAERRFLMDRLRGL